MWVHWAWTLSGGGSGNLASPGTVRSESYSQTVRQVYREQSVEGDPRGQAWCKPGGIYRAGGVCGLMSLLDPQRTGTEEVSTSE